MSWPIALRVAASCLTAAEALLLCLVCRLFKELRPVQRVLSLDPPFFLLLSRQSPGKQRLVLRQLADHGACVESIVFPTDGVEASRWLQELRVGELDGDVAALIARRSAQLKRLVLPFNQHDARHFPLLPTTTPPTTVHFGQLRAASLGVPHLETLVQCYASHGTPLALLEELKVLPHEQASLNSGTPTWTQRAVAIRAALPGLLPGLRRLTSGVHGVYAVATQGGHFSQLTHLAVRVDADIRTHLESPLPPSLQVLCVDWGEASPGAGREAALVQCADRLLQVHPALTICIAATDFIPRLSPHGPAASLALQPDNRDRLLLLPVNVHLFADRWAADAAGLQLLMGTGVQAAHELWPLDDWLMRFPDGFTQGLTVSSPPPGPQGSDTVDSDGEQTGDMPGRLELARCRRIDLRGPNAPLFRIPPHAHFTANGVGFRVLSSDMNLEGKLGVAGQHTHTHTPLSPDSLLGSIAKSRAVLPTLFFSSFKETIGATPASLQQLLAAHPETRELLTDMFVALAETSSDAVQAEWQDLAATLPSVRKLRFDFVGFINIDEEDEEDEQDIQQTAARASHLLGVVRAFPQVQEVDITVRRVQLSDVRQAVRELEGDGKRVHLTVSR